MAKAAVAVVVLGSWVGGELYTAAPGDSRHCSVVETNGDVHMPAETRLGY
jgi:hypothetical protein